jgi:hypothetical protein
MTRGLPPQPNNRHSLEVPFSPRPSTYLACWLCLHRACRQATPKWIPCCGGRTPHLNTTLLLFLPFPSRTVPSSSYSLNLLFRYPASSLPSRTSPELAYSIVLLRRQHRCPPTSSSNPQGQRPLLCNRTNLFNSPLQLPKSISSRALLTGNRIPIYLILERA